jgi:hypothetical protein
VDERIRQLVRERAGLRCEYCRLAQAAASSIRFHIEHIRPPQHGGSDQLDNLALACPNCNWNKGPNSRPSILSRAILSRFSIRAVSRGAKEVPGSLTIGILPSQSSDVAPDIDVAIVTDVHNARNNIITLSSDAVIACGIEGPGTTSEIPLCLAEEQQTRHCHRRNRSRADVF